LSQSSTASPAIVITGASTGIGRACALELDRRGFRVFAGVRNEGAARELKSLGSAHLTPIMVDVTDTDSITAAAATVSGAVSEAGIAGLVNNAGICMPGPLEVVPVAALRRQFEVNVIGPVAVTQAFLPLLRKARGRLVNISSISGGIAASCMGPYAASKFALEAINDAFRQELGRFGIHVASVAPGAIDTPIWNKSLAVSDELCQQAASDVLALYESEMAAARAYAAHSIRSAAPVERVVRAVVHALTDRRPKTHYYLGWSVRFCFKSGRLLSDRVRDWILRKLVGTP
jgi:NAD(P)-dependent dehydrogenase (short-subunit alcohol dehydrogenase family)